MIELDDSGSEFSDNRTGVAHARAMHFDEAFAGLKLFGLFDWIVLADFYRCSRLGNNGGDLDVWDVHCRGVREERYQVGWLWRVINKPN